jgi:hypothetical protein
VTLRFLTGSFGDGGSSAVNNVTVGVSERRILSASDFDFSCSTPEVSDFDSTSAQVFPMLFFFDSLIVVLGLVNRLVLFFLCCSDLHNSGFMIKSYPSATGYVTNVLYESSTMNQVAYPLDIDMYWQGSSETPASVR